MRFRSFVYIAVVANDQLYTDISALIKSEK